VSNNQLAHIRELIKQKRYDEARARLIPLSERGHPTAQRWLDQLEQRTSNERPATQQERITTHLDTVQKQKEQHYQVQAQQKARRRRFGCLLRMAFLLSFCACATFTLGPMLLAVGIVSNDPQVNNLTSDVLAVIEDQQDNPVGRAVTRFYAETSGRITEAVVIANTGQICDIAIEQAATEGNTINRDDCEETVREASVCVTDELIRAEQCLYEYVFNRCVQQAGNTPEGRDFCADFVAENLGAPDD